MLVMREHDRRALTSGLLRVLKASSELTGACLAPSALASAWGVKMVSSEINQKPAWDENLPFQNVRASIERTAEAARQHGLAMFELSRSRRALSVPLATVTRGSIEAYGRMLYLLDADDPDDLFARHASLEYYDMDYPLRHGSKPRRLPLEVEATHAVDVYRSALKAWADLNRLTLTKKGPAGLATALLTQLYPNDIEAEIVYSGLSATAHGQTWATANFFNFEDKRLQRDDKMLLEYAMYLIKTIELVDVKLASRFDPERITVERWQQTNEQVRNVLIGFVAPKAR